MRNVAANIIFVTCLTVVMAQSAIAGNGETASVLLENARSLIKEAETAASSGDNRTGIERYQTAEYMLEKIGEDFPDWKPDLVLRELNNCRTARLKLKSELETRPTPTGEFTVSCVWQMIFPGEEFEPEPEEAYRIEAGGDDRKALDFSFRKDTAIEGDPRICVQLHNTKKITVLQDINNPGLFRSESGKFTLELFIPPNCRLYLADFSPERHAPPDIVSNIVELP